MKLQVFKTLWGMQGTYTQAIREAHLARFNGLEGPAPSDPDLAREVCARLEDTGMHFIAEITTAGSYVPDPGATLEQHLESLRRKLELSQKMSPLFVTCLGGRDAWSDAQSLDFFGGAIELARQYELTISFETHRGRSLFNPWVTSRIVEQLPDMLLTFDLSHWCVVCESMLDGEDARLRALARHAHHVHARVGYEQGPQVPDPAAPEYLPYLRKYQSWWEMIWNAQSIRGYTRTTMTPEFGPDGYLHLMPYTLQPVADLWTINQWMANEERLHFQHYMHGKIHGAKLGN